MRAAGSVEGSPLPSCLGVRKERLRVVKGHCEWWESQGRATICMSLYKVMLQVSGLDHLTPDQPSQLSAIIPLPSRQEVGFNYQC